MIQERGSSAPVRGGTARLVGVVLWLEKSHSQTPLDCVRRLEYTSQTVQPNTETSVPDPPLCFSVGQDCGMKVWGCVILLVGM